jgi:hypothetical protein
MRTSRIVVVTVREITLGLGGHTPVKGVSPTGLLPFVFRAIWPSFSALMGCLDVRIAQDISLLWKQVRYLEQGTYSHVRYLMSN